MSTFLQFDVQKNYDQEIENLPPRLLELRTKIHDANYLDNAINRIAYILSKNLIDNSEELQLNSEEY
ncbi:MAG: hypothetical protein K2F89_05580 [Treponemataceae bacterium]|nr:hypothetical protein [Treponema sp.]MBD5438353.1 hypothetical protein [Treponema sp.]MBD5439954.1 hypothetical protein [Treponema sp.]MDE6068407.1 hypothetical protein [Treponemataceae bacterium]